MEKKVTPWMKGTIATNINRGHVKMTAGTKCLAHYQPAKIDEAGKMLRPEGYKVYVGKVWNGHIQTAFAFLDEVSVVTKDCGYCPANNFMTDNDWLGEAFITC